MMSLPPSLRRVAPRPTILVSVFLLCLTSVSGDADSPETSTDTNIQYKCEPSEGGGEPTSVPVNPNTTKVVFSCGGHADAVLAPQNTNANHFYEDNNSTVKLKSLASVCQGAKITESKTDSKPTVYTLELPLGKRNGTSIHYKCTRKQTHPVEKTISGGSLPQDSAKILTCALKFDVKESQASPETHDTTEGKDEADSTDGESHTTPPAGAYKTCDPDGTDARELLLAIKPGQPSVRFSCGKNDTTLKPNAGEQRYCLDGKCEKEAELSSVCEGTRLEKTQVGEETVFTLSTSSWPTSNKDLYFICASRTEQPQTIQRLAEDPENVKNCTVRITVEAEVNHEASGAQGVRHAALWGLLPVLVRFLF